MTNNVLSALAIASGVVLLAAPLQIAFASTQTGRSIALAQDKGHCQACHQLPSDSAVRSRATVGPPLVNIKSRFPDRSALAALIADARAANPRTVMPPYGAHRILTEAEIAHVVDYLYSQ